MQREKCPLNTHLRYLMLGMLQQYNDPSFNNFARFLHGFMQCWLFLLSGLECPLEAPDGVRSQASRISINE